MTEAARCFGHFTLTKYTLMKTSVTPYVLSEHETSRLRDCENLEISIILGDDAYHNLRISLQHAKLLLAKGEYDRIYYINLPFSGKRFSADYKAAEFSDDKRLVIYHVSNGYLAETIREIKQMMALAGEVGRSAVIINSWEMGSRTYRHREDLIFTLYNMQMLSECTFFVYSVADAKHIIMRRSSRASFGRLVMICDELVDLSTGKNRIGKEEKDSTGNQKRKRGPGFEGETLYLSNAVYYAEGEERDDFIRRHQEQQDRLRGIEAKKTEDEQIDEPVAVTPDGVCVNLDDSKINELPTHVWENDELRMMKVESRDGENFGTDKMSVLVCSECFSDGS